MSMPCPVCDGVMMKEVEKDGVMIDICPSCKGVWLDRGELDKLMKEVHEVKQEYNDWYYNHHKPHVSYHSPYPYHYPKHKKKKSVIDILGDLFD